MVFSEFLIFGRRSHIFQQQQKKKNVLKKICFCQNHMREDNREFTTVSIFFEYFCNLHLDFFGFINRLDLISKFLIMSFKLRKKDLHFCCSNYIEQELMRTSVGGPIPKKINNRSPGQSGFL